METEEKKSPNTKNDYLLPASIVLAALLIAGAWVYSTGLKSVNPNQGAANVAQNTQSPQNVPAQTVKMQPIDSTDHIRGNPASPVKIVEYSDLECPFCKMFHQTMFQVMNDYGKSGRVAWVYRHYPIEQLHSKALTSAEGAECANEQGGNDKFWAFVDKYFSMTPSNNQVDLAILPQIARSIGLDVNRFNSCVAAKKYESEIKASVEDAQNAGARGTPYSVVVAKNGKTFPIEGAQPYNEVRSLIEEALR